ncbi:MAG: hypothetical protein PS018_11685 [bacterium]|nr:hypothetical protein [bacterium]
MAALLAGTAIVGALGAAQTGAQIGGETPAPKRMTAAEKRAAEQAAKEAAEAAEKANQPEQQAAAAQDAKDEIADEKPAETEALKLNHDSVRKMLGGYVMAYGMEAAQEDGTKIIGAPKISDLADDQKVLGAAVIAIATAIEKNPHKRELAGDGITKEKTAELKPFVVAALAATK